MRIPVYLINLDRSVERLNAIVEDANKYQIEIRRVPAVDGRALTPEQWAEIAIPTFERVNGKRVLPAEIGCYLSHLKALEAIADGPDEMAVIIEDDIEFKGDFADVLGELSRVDGWDVVKLFSNRTTGFINRHTLNERFAVGRCVHGPLGNAAAYLVRQEAARALLKCLRPMVVPVDVALERGWAHRAAVFTLNKPIVRFTSAPSTILTAKGGYKSMKFPFYRRVGTLLYRASEYVRRVTYALTPTRLSRSNAAS